MKTGRNKNALTLIEILVAVALVAILVSMVVGIAGRVENQKNQKALKGLFMVLESALKEYREEQGTFFPDPNYLSLPHSSALYKQLKQMPQSRKLLDAINESFMEQNSLDPNVIDPWEMVLDYRYTAGDNFPVIVSAGPDRIFNTVDDITNKD